jgi:protein-S-isoprenylcysteine O-methyltransferase Ste14
MAGNLNVRALRQSVVGLVLMGLVLFVPAGTLAYWQAWVFLGLFTGASAVITVYLAIHAPDLLERRMRVGPAAETERTQKIAVSVALAGFVVLLVVPAFDRRFGWSRLPAVISLAGDALIALSFVGFWRVMKENRFSAATVQIAGDQRVISSGPYALVRHPMYAAAVPMIVAIPLALGSWWGLLGLVLFFPALIWRLLDEEAFLTRSLPGYREYAERVRYRLVPFVW